MLITLMYIWFAAFLLAVITTGLTQWFKSLTPIAVILVSVALIVPMFEWLYGTLMKNKKPNQRHDITEQYWKELIAAFQARGITKAVIQLDVREAYFDKATALDILQDVRDQLVARDIRLAQMPEGENDGPTVGDLVGVVETKSAS